MMTAHEIRGRVAGCIALVASVLLVALVGPSEAQQAQQRRTAPVTQSRPPLPVPKAEPPPVLKAAPVPIEPGEVRETVQADVSTRSVAITSSYTGTQIVVFGAVDNSRQTSPESGYYDIVILLEGTSTELVARRKSNVAGIWVNTQSLRFSSVPSYYAIASTRPLDEIASPNVLRENDLGFEAVRMTPVAGWESGLSTADLEDFKAAVIRLKRNSGLYVQQNYDVVFIGRSLFRASIDLPANVPVGPLVARVYLFQQGRLLSTYATRVQLQREGLERFLHTFAVTQPLLYGMFTVAVAVAAGLLASATLQRARA